MNEPDYSYLGNGIILIRPWGQNVEWSQVGNCSECNVEPQSNTLSLPDYTNPGGGEANSVDRVTGYNLTYTFHSFKGENFARTMRGVATTVAAATVAAEPAWAYKGAYVPLKYPATAIASVEPAGGGTPYEAGDDYILDRGMLFIPATSSISNASSAANIEVDYTHGAIDHVEAAVTGQQFFEMQFRGQNEARGGKNLISRFHRVKGGMLQQMGLLGEQYGAGTVQGSLLADSAKATGSNVSKFFSWSQEV